MWFLSSHAVFLTKAAKKKIFGNRHGHYDCRIVRGRKFILKKLKPPGSFSKKYFLSHAGKNLCSFCDYWFENETGLVLNLNEKVGVNVILRKTTTKR